MAKLQSVSCDQCHQCHASILMGYNDGIHDAFTSDTDSASTTAEITIATNGTVPGAVHPG